MRNFWRVALGTVIYLVIVVVATPYPTAAGLMLMFPALNGLGFLYTEGDRIPGMAKTMLLMPLVNGALCALYIFAFLIFSYTVPTTWLAWILFLIISGLWWLITRQNKIRSGISRERQLRYTLVVTSVGVALLTLSFPLVGSLRVSIPTEVDIGTLHFIRSAIIGNWYNVGLFAIAVSVFLLFSERLMLSDAGRGILAGLPLVPFAGLVSIAVGQDRDITERIGTLKGMALGIWLGPAAAVWFVFLLSIYLSARRGLESACVEFSARLAAVLTAWILCGAVMAIIARLVRLLA